MAPRPPGWLGTARQSRGRPRLNLPIDPGVRHGYGDLRGTARRREDHGFVRADRLHRAAVRSEDVDREAPSPVDGDRGDFDHVVAIERARRGVAVTAAAATNRLDATSA